MRDEKSFNITVDFYPTILRAISVLVWIIDRDQPQSGILFANLSYWGCCTSTIFQSMADAYNKLWSLKQCISPESESLAWNTSKLPMFCAKTFILMIFITYWINVVWQLMWVIINQWWVYTLCFTNIFFWLLPL